MPDLSKYKSYDKKHIAIEYIHWLAKMNDIMLKQRLFQGSCDLSSKKCGESKSGEHAWKEIERKTETHVLPFKIN
jgi:hypothetical protein